MYLGQEAVAAGAIGALNDDDLITTTYPGHGHAIAKGVPLKLLMTELFGKGTETCKGLGGSMHAAMYPEKASPYATAIRISILRHDRPSMCMLVRKGGKYSLVSASSCRTLGSDPGFSEMEIRYSERASIRGSIRPRQVRSPSS